MMIEGKVWWGNSQTGNTSEKLQEAALQSDSPNHACEVWGAFVQGIFGFSWSRSHVPAVFCWIVIQILAAGNALDEHIITLYGSFG